MSLFPFVDTNLLDKYIGRSILEGEDMIKIFEMLTGETEHKPFECVGTVDENRLAMQLCIDKNPNTVVTRHFLDHYHYIKPTQHQLDTILYHYDDDNHTIPNKWRPLFKKNILDLLKNQPSIIEGFTDGGKIKNSNRNLINTIVLFGCIGLGYYLSKQSNPPIYRYIILSVMVIIIINLLCRDTSSTIETFQTNNGIKLSIVPQMFLESAKELNIPYHIIDSRDSRLSIGNGDKTIYFRHVYNTLNNSDRVQLARNKYKTYLLFQQNNIPIPQFNYIDGLTNKSIDSVLQDRYG